MIPSKFSPFYLIRSSVINLESPFKRKYFLSDTLSSQSQGRLEHSEAVEFPFQTPSCYIFKNRPKLDSYKIKTFPDKVLFYMTYNQPYECNTILAAKELESRGWLYDEKSLKWISKTERGCQIFDPEIWEVVN